MTATLPWAETRGEATRAKRKILENIFAVGGIVGFETDELL
jgi:hypothetical protein